MTGPRIPDQGGREANDDKFVYSDKDVDGLTVDTSEAEGEDLGVAEWLRNSTSNKTAPDE